MWGERVHCLGHNQILLIPWSRLVLVIAPFKPFSDTIPQQRSFAMECIQVSARRWHFWYKGTLLSIRTEKPHQKAVAVEQAQAHFGLA